MSMIALTTGQGTAAAETALCPDDDTPQNRSIIEHDTPRQAKASGLPERDWPRAGSWVDASYNDALACVICGVGTCGTCGGDHTTETHADYIEEG